MPKRYNFSVHDDLAVLISKEASSRFVDDNDAIRAILAEHLTGRCTRTSVSPSGSQMATEGAGADAKATKKDAKVAALLAMSDAEMTERLKEIGYFPKDFTDTYLTAADPCAPDGRWRKHLVVTNGLEREYWQIGHDKDGTEAKMETHQWESRLRVFKHTDQLIGDLKKEKML